MKTIIKLLLGIFIFFISINSLTAQKQERLSAIEIKLMELAKSNPGLIEKVDLSVTNVSLQEFIRGLGVSNNLNISIDPGLKLSITNNFSNVTVMDIILFLVEKYDLEINFIGSIMSFSQYSIPLPEPVIYVPKRLAITYNSASDILGLDLKDDSLYLVTKEITRLSQKNVVHAPYLGQKVVNGFIQNISFENSLEKFAFANDLKITKTEDNSYLIEKKDAETNVPVGKSEKNNKKGNYQSINTGGADFNIKVDNNLLTVDAVNIPILDIISGVSFETGKNYFLFSEPKGNATLKIKNVSYDQFLSYLLNGTDFTFRKEGEIYLMGDRNLEGLRATKVVQLQNRTIDKVIDFIPVDLKKGVEIKTFPDLNSFILSGSLPRIVEIETFIRDIDRVVPVIMIEVILVDFKKNRTVSTGINAGLKDAPVTSGGKISPGIDFTFSASSINNLISIFNGFGVFNLGKVTPNFYLSIKALEEQGILNTRSTPKLATLNGNEAKMSIGKTEYYLEISNNVIGSQNPQNIISQQYKSVNADLSLTIKPIVSGDDQITLDIRVQQSDFTARINPNAPPGTVKRDFQSLIRVKNEEMIILGGLEEESTSDTGSGLPLLSRIPVLKWIFSSRINSKSKSKLNIFIKPTIIY
ncbi:MAG: general secretion pathway protein GspD [Bacteroidetes bacterium]|nr:general secretion pathway protein GspD [Bacteroidota bacterium]HET6243896.1 type II and III secretion system protein [Bacteroidia bacterium]